MVNDDEIGEWPYNVWKSIIQTFSSIFCDDIIIEKKKKMCSGLLDQLPKTSKSLVPFKNPHCDDYINNIEDCRCFNIWLFSRLYSIFLYDYFENQRQKCVDTQVTLLQYLWENDPTVYYIILQKYLEVFQDTCIIFESQEIFHSQRYQWFSFNCPNSNLPLTKAVFKVNNISQIPDLINFTIPIIISQMNCVFNLCTTVLSLLWRCSLSLLNRYPNKSLIYKFISSLMLDNEIPNHQSKFNPIVSKLLLHIRSRISVICQLGKLPEEEDFCIMLNIFSEKLLCDTCYDYSYVHTVYCLLMQCQLSLSQQTKKIILRFFTKLLQLSKSSFSVSDIDNNLTTTDLTLLFCILPNLFEENVRLIGKCEPFSKTLNIYQTNKYWKYLIDQIILQLQSGRQIMKLFKLLNKATRLAVDTTYQFHITFIFFADHIPSIIDILVKICECRVEEEFLFLLLKITKNILMLNECTMLDEQTQNILSTLLKLPWTLSYDSVSSLKLFYEKHVSLINEKLRQFSIISLMWVHKFRFENWRDQLFKDIFKNCTPNILESIPVLVYKFNNSDLNLFINYLLNLDNHILNEISTYVRRLICALSGHCVLSKLPNVKITLYCVLCDEECIFKTISPADYDRSDSLNNLIIRFMNCSDNTKYNVICAAVFLFNHVHKTDEFLALLRDCFLDSNNKIREKIIEITPYIIFGNKHVEPFTYDDSIFHSFRKCLRAVTLEALMNENEIIQYVCLNAITKIGCIPLEITLLPGITMLLSLMITATSAYSPLAKSSIQQVAIAHNVEVEDHIYLKYHENVFPLVTRIIVINYSVFGTSLVNLSCDHSSVFNNLTVTHVLQYLLPYVAKDVNLRILLEELATLCGMSTAQMLRNAFKHIFPYVMLFEKMETKKRVMEIVYKETNNTITDLLSCCVTKVLAELFVYYEEFEEQVKWVLFEIKGLANLSKTEKSSREITNTNIEFFLQSRFFGVLMKLENQLCVDMISNMTRRRVLSSFKTIIRFMSSSYITSVRFKVLFTLRTITDTEKEKMPLLCIEIWNTFVRKINCTALGPILSNIFVSLLAFTETYRKQVNEIFHYLLVENKEAVLQHLIELYFVQSHQCGDDIFQIICQAETNLARMKLTDRLEWLLEATKHEITEIKLHALQRLKCELANNRKDISLLILASDSVNSLIFRVLDILVEGFRNPDVNIQEASGACLGEFGAIDPSYIPNIVIKVDDAGKYNCYDIDDVEFVVRAFTLLCRGFQMAKTSSNMDTFALAIQSMLSTYEVTQNEECKYWSQIPKNLREIIQPFYSTTYTLLINANEASYDIPHLVYGSNKAQTVQKWAYNWSNFLISLLPTDLKAKNVFLYCKGPMSCEINCMFLFLPHILLNAVLCSDDVNLSKIYEEMISVIRYDTTGVEDENFIQKTSTQLIVSEELSVMSNTDLEMGVICTKTMFHLLDVLFKKYRSMRVQLRGRQNSDCNKLNIFLNKFSKYQLAEKSFERKEYVRSLRYLEEYLESENVSIEKHLVLLAKIYVHLNDVDNIKGLFAAYSIKLSQLQNVIMLHEITEQFQDAAICYQQLLKTADSEHSPIYEKRMIQCYLAMNQPETALRFVKSLSAMNAKHAKFLYDVECEALWNLSQFDKLEELTCCKSAKANDNWGVRIGQSIIHFLNRDQQNLVKEFYRIRSVLTKSLHMSTTAFGSYRDTYEETIKLHILNEFEKVADLVFGIIDGHITDEEWKSKFQSVIKTEFEERLNKLQPTSRALQPVLNIRQVLFSVAGRLLSNSKPELVVLFNDEVHKCWLKVIEIANRTRNFQLAYSNIIAIDNYQLKGFFIEKAKYYWEKMEQQEALRTLQHGLQFHFSDYRELRKSNASRIEDKKICAEAFMLLGTYNDTVANTDCATNLSYFERAYEVCQRWEKTLVKMAQYQYKIIRIGEKQDFFRKQPELWVEVVAMYGKSLLYGCEFIYQSLSRMLNVWLDFAKSLKEDKMNSRLIKEVRKSSSNVASLESRKTSFQKMHKLIQELLSKLPTYYFMTAFSLIMSRLSHPVQDCFFILKSIIIQCTLNFPNQALWQFMSLYRVRTVEGPAGTQVERVNKVLSDPSLTALNPTICKFKELFEEFSKLSRATKANSIAHGKTLLIDVMKRQSPLLQDGHFDDILIPAQKFLTIVLPRSANKSMAVDSTYNPFPEKMVFIAKIRNEAFVYNSLQKPVRVGLVGTDGHIYPMIFKAMDDLRIDSRAMEFNSVVNTYLKRDVEGRDRGLRIRTYTVLPLIEKCGLIEFIPDLDSMRSITLNMRRSLGLKDVSTKKLNYDTMVDGEKKDCFKRLCELFTPVLHEWYKLEFPNPSSWYAARTSYVRTLAVMSIVGYILGLGDRHNDNILLDYTNGDVVHVDFNALFNKGETLPVPERVPFRLTHSMIKAMGPLGYEGSFLYTCEIVNRILRSHKEQLISILNTFLYDPLDFFVSKTENMYTAAENNLQNVEYRMNGGIRSNLKNNSIPLSVEGQTRKLIEEATDIDNLYLMFSGWGAFM